MTDLERQELWVKLQARKAELHEAIASLDASGIQLATHLLNGELNAVEIRICHFRSAASIRKLLAKIESIGDVGGE